MNSIAINVFALKLIWNQFSKMIKRSWYVEEKVMMFNVCDELSMWLIKSIISSTSNKMKSLIKRSNLKNLLNIVFMLDWIADSKHCFIEIELNLLANFSDLNDLKNLLNLIFDVFSWIIESINKLIDVEINDVDLNLIFDFDLKLTTTIFCFIVFWATIVTSFIFIFNALIFSSFSILTSKVFCLWYIFFMIKYDVWDDVMQLIEIDFIDVELIEIDEKSFKTIIDVFFFN